MVPKNYLKTEILHIGRVTKILEKGKVIRFKVIVASGNFKNIIGLGIGKDINFHVAKKKAIEDSYKNLTLVRHFITIDKFKTIPFNLLIKLKKTKVLFKQNPIKTGIRASKLFFVLSKLAGFDQLLVKQIMSRNIINNIYAFFKFIDNLNDLK